MINPYVGLAPLITPEQRQASNAAFEAKHAATKDRLRQQTEANTALRREMIVALEWCKANGNPHRKADREGYRVKTDGKGP